MHLRTTVRAVPPPVTPYADISRVFIGNVLCLQLFIIGCLLCMQVGHIIFCIIADGQFPIDLESVKRDHAFLEPDDLEALFR